MTLQTTQGLFQTIAIQTALGVLHMCISHYEVVWLPAKIKRLLAEARAERIKARAAAKLERRASKASVGSTDYGGD